MCFYCFPLPIACQIRNGQARQSFTMNLKKHLAQVIYILMNWKLVVWNSGTDKLCCRWAITWWNYCISGVALIENPILVQVISFCSQNLSYGTAPHQDVVWLQGGIKTLNDDSLMCILQLPTLPNITMTFYNDLFGRAAMEADGAGVETGSRGRGTKRGPPWVPLSLCSSLPPSLSPSLPPSLLSVGTSADIPGNAGTATGVQRTLAWDLDKLLHWFYCQGSPGGL